MTIIASLLVGFALGVFFRTVYGRRSEAPGFGIPWDPPKPPPGFGVPMDPPKPPTK